MEKLYYNDQYIKDFTAEVENIVEKDGSFHVVLDKTAFYPEGGGQPSDVGFIDNLEVNYVYEEDGIIYHVMNKKPMKIHRVKCEIDFEKRFDTMQQHLGQHILSAAIRELFNGETVGFHLGKEVCVLDINKFLSKEQLQEAENLANKIIKENISVEVLYPTKSELKKLGIKKDIPKTNEPLRIVKISDIDINPCCGVHPKSTIEVQVIKIKKSEKYKTNTRIEMFSGNRAINHLMFRDTFASKICSTLKCDEEGALNQVDKLSSEVRSLQAENKVLKNEIADYEVKETLNTCKDVNGVKIVKVIHENTDMKYLNVLASKLTSYDNVIVLFALKGEGTCNLLFMCSKGLKAISMNDLLKDAISLIDGKGGGSASSAQGGGKSVNNLESALNYAVMKVETTIK